MEPQVIINTLINYVLELETADPPEFSDKAFSEQNKWLKSICPDGAMITHEMNVYFWDCPSCKAHLNRCAQSFTAINSNDFHEELVCDLDTLRQMMANPPRIDRKGIRYARANSKAKLREILIEYTSGGGMAAFGHIRKAKSMLEIWAKENNHPLCSLLLSVDHDFIAAQQWLIEVAKELETVPAVKSIHNYIVFLDVVSYSAQTEEKQLAIVQEITTIVKDEIGKFDIEQDEDFIVLPTGDGMAICFINGKADLTADAAVAIMTRIRASKVDFKIKMGLHSQPDQTYIDFNGRMNVCGPGINLAARVMDQAQSDQILVSSNMNQQLAAKARFRDKLKDAGERTLKHDIKERMYELMYDLPHNPENKILTIMLSDGDSPMGIGDINKG
jgi:class 3 adenylate cyclase